MRGMGSQSVGHDWATEMNWTELNERHSMIFRIPRFFPFSSLTSLALNLSPDCSFPSWKFATSLQLSCPLTAMFKSRSDQGISSVSFPPFLPSPFSLFSPFISFLSFCPSSIPPFLPLSLSLSPSFFQKQTPPPTVLETRNLKSRPFLLFVRKKNYFPKSSTGLLLNLIVQITMSHAPPNLPGC